MEAVLFVGLQGAGKSAFYREHYFLTHLRLNLDMLKTRHRQKLLLEACHASKQRYVLDNTNAGADERAHHIHLAKRAGFRVIGVFFDIRVEDALRRNALRPEAQRVPPVAIYATRKRLQPPTYAEGFDRLVRVTPGPYPHFEVHTVPPPLTLEGQANEQGS